MRNETYLDQLLRAARRRQLINVAAEQLALAGAIGLGGVALLLVLGTQILDWYWPALLAAVALGVGGWRAVRDMPTRYGLMRRIDERLELHDELSTAYHFQHASVPKPAPETVVRAQRERAEATSVQIDPAAAVPFRWPRRGYVTVFALVAAASLFLLRYGMQRNLDLRPPLSPQIARFFLPDEEMVEAWQEAEEAAAEETTEAAGERSHEHRREGRFDEDADSVFTAVETDGVETDGLAPDDGQFTDEPGDESADGRPAGEEPGEASAPPLPANANAANTEKAGEAGGQEESELLRKMQDAFANLLASMNLEAKGTSSKRAPSKDGQQRSARQAEARERLRDQAEQMAKEAGLSPASASNGQTQQGQQQGSSSAEAEGQLSDQPGQQNAPSGAGQMDGSKDVELAEKLEAAGKISEILGQRAKNLKGEIMVEATQSSQRLRTEYTEGDTDHRQTAAGSRRDEIPLALQPYVRKYFEQLRRDQSIAEPTDLPPTSAP